MYTNTIPPIDSFEYFRWRGQIDGHTLRTLMPSNLESQLMNLRVRLSQFHSISSDQLNNHSLLEVAARLIRVGELHIRPSWGGVEFCSYLDAKHSQTAPQWRPELGRFSAFVNPINEDKLSDPSARPKSTNWVEVQIRNQKTGAAISSAEVTLKGPDGQLHKVFTDVTGIARVDGIASGTAEIVNIKYPDALELHTIA